MGGEACENLMLSSNLLKSKIPMLRVGGGGEARENQFPKVYFKFSKYSPELKFPFSGGRGGGSWNLVLLPSMHLG